MRYEIKPRIFNDDICYSLWDNQKQCWYMEGYGYIKGKTKEDLEADCERLNKKTK